MKKITLLAGVTGLLFLGMSPEKEKYPYQDPNLPIEQRIDDLLKRMTPEEKARQLDMYRGREITQGVKFSPEKTQKAFGDAGVGSVHDLYPVSVEVTNQIQDYCVNHTRLGIPALMIEEALHGYCGKGSTVFPATIAIASTWDTALVKEIAHIIAKETRAYGVHMALAPMLDVARDPRWGRVEETMGEDPFLIGKLGLYMVKGMQGTDISKDDAIAAEPKPFAVYGVPEAGSNTSPVYVSEREARTVFISVFKESIIEGDAMAIMSAYNELDGVPCPSSKWLLTDILRKEWGFKGFVISDLGAIQMMYRVHKTASSPKDAIVQALNAGNDMQFYDFPHDEFQQSIVKALKDGSLSQEVLDNAVRRVLRVKFKLGLFENPYTDVTLVSKRVKTPENESVSLKSSLESVCLLKNQNNTLPYDITKIKKLAVIGPLADFSALGGYTTKDAKGVTVYEGLKKEYGNKIDVQYASGCYPEMIHDVLSSDYLVTKVGNKEEKGLTGYYYSNPDLKGEPVDTIVDDNFNILWSRAPMQNMPKDSFSVRWVGDLIAPVTGEYEFRALMDDRGRLYINDKLIIDKWDCSGLNVGGSQKVSMKAGQRYPVRIELADLSQFAELNLSWQLVTVPKEENKELTKAVELAKQSDAVVIVLGEAKGIVGEGKDRASLDLPQQQEELLKAVMATGKPVAMVLLNGRPLSINWAAENVPAIMEAWFPGDQGGIAIARTIFGDNNPSGKMPVTVPRSVGQIPIYYNYKPSSRHTYVDEETSPLYYFGHGLSYTTFAYKDIHIDKDSISLDGTAELSFTISNTGKYAGEEVVQMYIRDEISSVTRPVKELKGFQRIKLNPGESKKGTFRITPDLLEMLDINMKWVVEPGYFNIMLGSSSKDIRLSSSLKVYKK